MIESEFFNSRDENGMLPKERELYEREGELRAYARGCRERREDELATLTVLEKTLLSLEREELIQLRTQYLRLTRSPRQMRTIVDAVVDVSENGISASLIWRQK